MTSIILGSGGTAGVSIGGDIGGTNANPQVVGSHFGGSAGNFWVNRAGLWVPDTIKSTDLPAISSLVNGAITLVLGADGIVKRVAGAATLGALGTNVASQFINGNAARGYVRITAGATGPTANGDLVTVNFPATLLQNAFIYVCCITDAAINWGDTVVATTPFPGSIYARVSTVNTPPSSFTVRCTGSLSANANQAFVYAVLE